ncbi:MAG: FAD-dependent oxidoreductase [Candidatus Diapherotrites archaeon]|nr:FAD-dependent oxidoreductase [Candidatus Diapherotrites archaeon]
MYDLIILGRGPAGLTAAVYAGRAGLKTLVLGKEPLVWKSEKIENYLGFPEGISGQELLEKGREQAEKYGAEFVDELAISVLKAENFTVKTSSKEFESKAIIISTGVSFKLSGIDNEADFVGQGVSYCVTCDGFFFRKKKVCVVGSEDYAANEALELHEISQDVTIFTQSNEPNFSEEMKKKLDAHSITVDTHKIKLLKGNPLVSHIILETGEEIEMNGVFVALGTASSVDFSRTLGVVTEGNFIKVDGLCKTGVEGVFAAGDCTQGPRQIAKAVGQGAVAALSTIEFVKGSVSVDWH